MIRSFIYALTKWLVRIVLAGILALTVSAIGPSTSHTSAMSGRITHPDTLISSAFPPAVIRTSPNDSNPNALTVVVTKTDNQVWYRQQVCEGCGWGSWNALSGLYTVFPPIVGMDLDGALNVFVIGGQGTGYPQLYHNYQVCAGCGWNGWVQLTSGVPKFALLSIGQNQDGHLEVFLNNSTVIQHLWELCPNCSGSWSNLTGLDNGSDVGSDVIAVGQDSSSAGGRLEVFALGTSGYLYHDYETKSNCCWSGWSPFDKSTEDASASVGLNANGELEVFVRRHNDGNIWTAWQTCPGCGWSSLLNLGGSLNTSFDIPGVGVNQDGRMEIFTQASTVYHDWETSPNSTNNWNGFDSLGGSVFSSVAVGQDGGSAGSRLEIFARSTGGDLQLNYQTQSNCCWHGWVSLGT